MTVSHYAVTAGVERLGKIGPWQQSGIGKNRIGNAFRRYSGKFPKKNAKNDRERKRTF